MALDPNARVPCYPAEEITSRFSVPLTTLVPSGSPQLYVALYPARETPTPNVVFLSTYVSGASPLLVIPVYEAFEVPSTFSVALSSLIASSGAVTVGTSPSPGGGSSNTADHSDPNNAYLAAIAA